jgi:hypothetical protein
MTDILIKADALSAALCGKNRCSVQFVLKITSSALNFRLKKSKN